MCFALSEHTSAPEIARLELRSARAGISKTSPVTQIDFPRSTGMVHTFYVRYLLPIWFDVQCFEYDSDKVPEKRWVYA